MMYALEKDEPEGSGSKAQSIDRWTVNDLRTAGKRWKATLF